MRATDFYDVRDDFLEEIGSTKEEDCVTKFMKYKLCENKTFDLDVSERVVKSYIQNYSFLGSGKLNQQMGSLERFEVYLPCADEIYRGDTMTSSINIFKHYINIINPIFEETFRGYKGLGSKMMELGKNSYLDKIDKEMIEFIRMGHTEGNFIPVPLRFNTERSGSFADEDFWDLVMKAVYDWYLDKTNNISLLMLFNGKEDSVTLCKQWLKHFDTWLDFINENHLQPYVNDRLEPIEFWEGHFEFNRKIVKLKDRHEFLEAVRLINKITLERNILIKNL